MRSGPDLTPSRTAPDRTAHGRRRHAVVTGAAGFVGSHLAERLVADGWQVVGVDCFTDYYPRADKEANLAGLSAAPTFDLVEADVAGGAWRRCVGPGTVVFHLAAQAGVRGSFGASFARYAHDNLVATQSVLEAAGENGADRVVWASSSSVYGDAEAYPCLEATTPTSPRSPYGVTKRACEDLARVYRNRGLHTVGLRYFTVYGPRQRPDMAMRRICRSLLDGTAFGMFGDGSQSRDFTFVSDAVDATVRAGVAGRTSPVYNVGGGEEATLAQVVAVLEAAAGRSLLVEPHPVQAGDVLRTKADVRLAETELGWRPVVRLVDGLAAEYAWTAQVVEAGRRTDRAAAGAAQPAVVG
jgi:UDP-glucuronate 4-epimerase